jgi:HTH-type transcriptional regulator / antitoxin HigA
MATAASRKLDFSRPRVLKTKRDYSAAVTEIDDLLDSDPKPGTEDYDRLEFLSVLVEAYDDEHYPIEDASPQDLVDFMLEQKGLTRTDLADEMGGRSRVSDFFAGKRELSVNQARRLKALLGIPLDLLLGSSTAA